MQTNKLISEYSNDFFNWIKQHIAILKEHRLEEIDIEHLIEELEDMGKSNVRELESRLIVLIAHLLKWQFQSDKRSSSWNGSIVEQRVRLLRLLKKMPSLKRELQSAIEDAYGDAILIASRETGLPETIFPRLCSYSVEQLLNIEFYPN